MAIVDDPDARVDPLELGRRADRPALSFDDAPPDRRQESAREAADRPGADRLRLDGAGPQPLVPAPADALPRPRGRPGARDLQRHDRRPPRAGRRRLRLRRGDLRLAASLRAPRCRRGRRHGAEHAPRRDRRGRERRRQARLLREAGGRHAGADRAGGGGRGGRGGDHGSRLQLPLRAARALRGAARRRWAARRGHRLPRSLLLHVRQRPPRPAELAVPAGAGRLRRLHRPPQPRGRPGAHAARADRERCRRPGDLHPRAAAARRRAARPTTAAAHRTTRRAP